jgi:1,4-dihydroxy-2-naphthoyl-CoA hydrolase
LLTRGVLAPACRYGDDMPSDPTIHTDSFNDRLGLTITSVSGDEIVGHMVLTPQLHQPFGIVHGGVYCAVVETVASYGAACWFGDKGNVVGVSNHTNFIRAVREGTLTVRSTPVHRGRTQQLWKVDITDESGRLIANGEVRLANIASVDSLGHASNT